MVFSSIIFLFFYLPLVLGKYIVLHPALRNGFLFLVSLVFYAWGEPVLVLAMIASTVLDYTCGLVIDKGFRRTGLIASVVGNLGLLGFFKYFNFIVENLSALFNIFHLPPSIFQHAPPNCLTYRNQLLYVSNPELYH